MPRQNNHMTEKNKNSSEVYADFTMSRIDSSVLGTMTPSQLRAVRDALVANQPFKRHSFDIRGTLPFIFASFYFVILAGRDKRRKTLDKEKRRVFEGNVSMAYVLSLLFLSFVGAVVWMAILLLLYWVKIELGMDFLPNVHFPDLFQSE
ncbi:MAG: hypothetical protein HKP55_10945 [Gammaproteobacteria bacterium]|nr:hypothetical protein [Gammaproteobacteria bacterium]